jgi:hypothetical protein
MSTHQALDSLYFWKDIPGSSNFKEAAMSYQTIWGLKQNGELWKCPLPCKEQIQWERVEDVIFKQIGVNPFEIWGIDQYNSLFQCRFPCHSQQSFNLIAKGLSKVTLGLSKVLAINTKMILSTIKYEFSHPITDLLDLHQWHSHPGDFCQVSIAEDGQVWAIDCKGKVLRYRKKHKQWLEVPGTLQKISVGPDYVFGVSRSNKLVRCRRPCKNGGWQLIDRGTYRSVDAQYSGLGMIMAVGVNGMIRIGMKKNYDLSDNRFPFNRKKSPNLTSGANTHYFHYPHYNHYNHYPPGNLYQNYYQYRSPAVNNPAFQ